MLVVDVELIVFIFAAFKSQRTILLAIRLPTVFD